MVDPFLTDDAVLRSLGDRLARARVRRNLTQQQLAAEAGVGKTTVERIENGKSVTLTNAVRVLRGLDLLDALVDLAPEAALQPVALARTAGRERRRASSPRHRTPDTPPAAPFAWGNQRVVTHDDGPSSRGPETRPARDARPVRDAAPIPDASSIREGPSARDAPRPPRTP